MCHFYYFPVCPFFCMSDFQNIFLLDWAYFCLFVIICQLLRSYEQFFLVLIYLSISSRAWFVARAILRVDAEGSLEKDKINKKKSRTFHDLMDRKLYLFFFVHCVTHNSIDILNYFFISKYISIVEKWDAILQVIKTTVENMCNPIFLVLDYEDITGPTFSGNNWYSVSNFDVYFFLI